LNFIIRVSAGHAGASFCARLREERIMQQILETLAIFFVALTAGGIVIALAYGIWDGFCERRHARRKTASPKHRPF
jgi:hypothetical protein